MKGKRHARRPEPILGDTAEFVGAENRVQRCSMNRRGRGDGNPLSSNAVAFKARFETALDQSPKKLWPGPAGRADHCTRLGNAQ